MFLSDLEVSKVEQFCADEVMFEAVKKVLLQSIYSHGTLKAGEPGNPLKNRALVLVGGDYDDAQLGLRLRALWEGVNALESGFDALEGYKTPAPEKDEVEDNPAI